MGSEPIYQFFVRFLRSIWAVFYKKLKNFNCEYDRWVVETQLCKLRLICRSYLQTTSCRPLCGQFQLFTPTQTNPTPDLTRTRTRTLLGARGWQGQSCGSAACFGGVFPNKPGRPRTQSRPIRLASCRKLPADSSCKEGRSSSWAFNLGSWSNSTWRVP